MPVLQSDRRRFWLAAGVAIVLIVALCLVCVVVWQPRPSASASAPSPSPTYAPSSTSPVPSPASTPPPSATATTAPASVLIGAGDICRLAAIDNARLTAALVEAEPSAVVFTLGDNSNDSGTAEQYQTCYGATWGAFKARTRPTPGNHDQMTSHGAPYFAYFGSAAGSAGKGYYSYDLAANWHVIVLNAICWEVDGCKAGSPQETWLRADLAANPGKHLLAMWHIPEFSSGWHGNTLDYVSWWRDLYAAHADIVLSGHDHDYERFAPQSPTGVAEAAGIRQFVVGTGGSGHTAIETIRANSEVRNNRTFGVLKLTLREHSYAWQFIPIRGGSFTDSGETATHT
jgi:3',5'-cyclic AMP phosphodiesterase CpdA